MHINLPFPIATFLITSLLKKSYFTNSFVFATFFTLKSYFARFNLLLFHWFLYFFCTYFFHELLVLRTTMILNNTIIFRFCTAFNLALSDPFLWNSLGSHVCQCRCNWYYYCNIFKYKNGFCEHRKIVFYERSKINFKHT